MSKNTKSGPTHNVVRVRREVMDIFGEDGKLYEILKKAKNRSKSNDSKSGQGANFGRRQHLIAKAQAREMRNFNVHHSACIDAKITSSVGLGHREQKIHDYLDPLCQVSWQDTLEAVAEDMIEGGDGYLEVVRGSSKDPELITGLYHVSGPTAYVEVEEQDNNQNYHYSMDGESTAGSGVVMARFGDMLGLKQRYGIGTGRRGRPSNSQRERASRRRSQSLSGRVVDSEIIHFRQPTARSRWYGFPDWLAATPSIELVQCMSQHEFDYFFNRGVPEFLLFVIGESLSKDCWDEVKAVLGSGQGLGNSHKSGAFNIQQHPDDVEIQIEKLAMESQDDGAFSKKSDTFASQIVSAHGVPAILAGLQIAGKMGGNNEGPNALLLFQKRKLGQIQRRISATLSCTIGLKGQRLNQPDGAPKVLTREDFLGTNHQQRIDKHGIPQHPERGNGFKSILDGMTLGGMETLATMREPLAGSARNPEDGKLSGQDDRKDGDPKARTKPGAPEKPEEKQGGAT